MKLRVMQTRIKQKNRQEIINQSKKRLMATDIDRWD